MRIEEGVFRQSSRSHRKKIDMATGAAPGRYTESQPPEETLAVKPDQGSGSTTTSQQVPSEKQRGLLKRAMQVWRTLSSQYLLFFAAVVVIIAAWQARKPVTVVAPFQVPDKGSVPFSGETVANVLQDHLVQIHQRIQNQNKDQKLHATDMHSLGQAGLQIPPDIKGAEYSRSEVPTQFAVRGQRAFLSGAGWIRSRNMGNANDHHRGHDRRWEKWREVHADRANGRQGPVADRSSAANRGRAATGGRRFGRENHI
jgi:hypothetical protein